MSQSVQVLRCAHGLLLQQQPVVVITVSNVKGSTPRELGAKMLVSRTEQVGTVGGGELEFQAIELAHKLLNKLHNEQACYAYERQFALGTNCGQCCGGVLSLHFQPMAEITPWLTRAISGQAATTLLLPLHHPGSAAANTVHVLDPTQWGEESLQPYLEQLSHGGAMRIKLPQAKYPSGEYLLEVHGTPSPRVAVFGAGHVGRALVDVLAKLDVQVVWVDPRKEQFPQQLPDNVAIAPHPQPEEFAAQLPSHTTCLVMTHNHDLDYQICTRLLSRQDISFCGLIGSTSKRRRFERLLRQGGLEHLLNRLTCPIGLDGIPGKTPYEIAVSVSAQILRHLSAQPTASAKPVTTPQDAALHH